MRLIIVAMGMTALSLVGSGCSKAPICPAYNTVHNTKNYANNPNNQARSETNNKADIEKRKEAELSGPKGGKKGRSYGLFPKWMGIKSR